jgi:REP element-mobilizing transposase RayT
MPNYRRAFVQGGCWFFTVNLLERRKTLLLDHIDALRDSVASTRQRYPFEIDAFVVLPDHIHAIWTLPPGDADFLRPLAPYQDRLREIIAQAGATEHRPHGAQRARHLVAAILGAHDPRRDRLRSARGLLLFQPSEARSRYPRTRLAAFVVSPRRSAGDFPA